MTMDLEDNMHDTNDLELVHKEFYSSKAKDYYSSNNDDTNDYDFINNGDDDFETLVAHHHKVCQGILSSKSLQLVFLDCVFRYITAIALSYHACNSPIQR